MPPKPQYKATSLQTHGFVMDDAWRSDDSGEESEGPTKIFTMDDDLDEPTDLDPRELHRRLRALKLQREAEAKRDQAAKADEGNKVAKGSEVQADTSKPTRGFSHTRHKSKNSDDYQENQNPTWARRPHPEYQKIIQENHDHSPDSEVIESGVCSPRSEGVWRANRKDVAHWPAPLENKEKRHSETG